LWYGPQVAGPPKRPLVVGVGELLWDCFADRRLPGGAPGNVAFHSTRLGARGLIVSRVGNDGPGRGLIDYLASRGMETDFVQVDPRLPTGRVTVDTSDPGSPSFEIHAPVAWDAIEFNPELGRLIERADALCVGTLAQRDETSRATIGRCLAAADAAGALVVYDVNLRQDWYRRSWIEKTLGHADVVKLNGGEVRALAPLLELGSQEAEPFAEALIRIFDIELVCVTRAEHGALLVGREQRVEVSGIPVEIADAVGAGDAFTAALIAGRLRGWPLAVIGPFANRLGALVAGSPGAMPELGEKLDELLGQAEAGFVDPDPSE